MSPSIEKVVAESVIWYVNVEDRSLFQVRQDDALWTLKAAAIQGRTLQEGGGGKNELNDELRAATRERATSNRTALTDDFLQLEGSNEHVQKGGSMSKLKLTITMSLDGFVAGPDQSVEHPLGIGGEDLHGWLVPLKAFRESHGEEGGEVNASTPFAEGILAGAGATIMGRNMFGGGPGPWDDEPWKGWWGDDPPYHHPVFVLTRYPREPLVMQGGTTFHFVTDGIESALEQARVAAGEKGVSLGGGASVAQQYLAAGLLDEIVVSIVPILLGSGARLFDNVGDATLEQVESVEAPGVTHIRYARA